MSLRAFGDPANIKEDKNMPRSINELVARFAEYIVKQEEASDSNEGNKYARIYINSFEELTDRYGDKGRDALSVLLEDEDPRIRCTTAAFLLRYKHKEAVEVLEKLAMGEGMSALAAKCSLDNWEEGIWELDPEPTGDTDKK